MTDSVYNPPTLDVEPRTLVLDTKTNQRVLWLKGIVALPVGSVVQLGDPNADATVTGIRLLAGPKDHPAIVVLDVEVPDAWWANK